jgi:type III secretion system FlhB-like substrate exporter
VYKEYLTNVQVLKEEKKSLIEDAKEKGIPKKEIDLATKALKQDIDMTTSTEIYANIADLVE